MTDQQCYSPRGVRLWTGLLMGTLMLISFSACSTISESSYRRRRTDPTTGDGPAIAARLSYTSLTAPIQGSGRQELETLSHSGHRQASATRPAAVLRRAYILTETGNAQEALNSLNQMLYGDVTVSPSVESYARFVRSLALGKLGKTELASNESQRAYELAIDDSLRQALRPNPVAVEPREASTPSFTMPRTLPRTAWQAKPPRRRASLRAMGQVTRLTVHHSASLARSTSERIARTTIRGIQNYHQGPEKGWADIGYHFLIDPAGRIWIGRSLAYQGAHAGDPVKNRGNIGICVLGNFVPASQRPTAAQTQALENLVGALCRRFSIPASQILPHSKFKTTECPGPYLKRTVLRMKQELAAQTSTED